MKIFPAARLIYPSLHAKNISPYLGEADKRDGLLEIGGEGLISTLSPLV